MLKRSQGALAKERQSEHAALTGRVDGMEQFHHNLVKERQLEHAAIVHMEQSLCKHLNVAVAKTTEMENTFGKLSDRVRHLEQTIDGLEGKYTKEQLHDNLVKQRESDHAAETTEMETSVLDDRVRRREQAIGGPAWWGSTPRSSSSWSWRS